MISLLKFMEENMPDKIEPNEYVPRINLVLSGGSIKGISQIGAVQKLIDTKLLDLSKLKSVAGSSVGAIIGILIVLGFSPEQIWEFILSIDTSKLVSPDFLLAFEKCGVDTGKVIYDLIEQIITQKTGIKHINFKQLYELTKINLTIVGSCLTTKEADYYSHINSPTLKVSMAIRISIGMPGFFVPIVMNGKKYIDGAIINNYPMNLFENELDQTIGILICNEYNTNYTYPEEFCLAIMNLYMYTYHKATECKYSKNTVYISKEVSELSIFNFDLDDQTKYKLYMSGMVAVEEFIKRQSSDDNKQSN